MLLASNSLKEYLRSDMLQDFWQQQLKELQPLYDYKHWLYKLENKFDLWLEWQKSDFIENYTSTVSSTMENHFIANGLNFDEKTYAPVVGFRKMDNIPVTQLTFAQIFPTYAYTPRTLGMEIDLDLYLTEELWLKVGKTPQRFFAQKSNNLWRSIEFPFWSPDLQNDTSTA
jgi:hypothetical protein